MNECIRHVHQALLKVFAAQTGIVAAGFEDRMDRRQAARVARNWSVILHAWSTRARRDESKGSVSQASPGVIKFMGPNQLRRMHLAHK